MGRLPERGGGQATHWVLATPRGTGRRPHLGAFSGRRAELYPGAVAKRARVRGEPASVVQAASGGARQRASGSATLMSAGFWQSIDTCLAIAVPAAFAHRLPVRGARTSKADFRDEPDRSE
jgi:hypothetical protein